MNLGIQIIERVRELHNLGFIHLDIKPSNIMADRREDSDVITGSYDFRLIDFGLITPFKNPNTQEPLEEVKDSKFMGTPYFCSLSMAKRNIYSRRDDIESTIYCLAYLIKGKLPWDQEYYLIEEEKCSPKSSQGNECDKILERK